MIADSGDRDQPSVAKLFHWILRQGGSRDGSSVTFIGEYEQPVTFAMSGKGLVGDLLAMDSDPITHVMLCRLLKMSDNGCLPGYAGGTPHLP